MIASLLVALQLATASPVLTVRGTGSTSEVPIARSAAGAAVRLDLLAPIVPLAIEDRGAGRYTITFAGVRFAVTDHAPFMEIGGRVVPLASAPYVVDGQLFLPLQAITEQLPRAAPDKLRYDAARGELRFLSSARADATVSATTTGARAAGSAARSSARAPDRTSRLGTRRRVVVDAGHGGPDRGMSGPIGVRAKVFEKDITLAVAKRLDAALRTRGVDVVMTRTTDTLIALSDRGRIANQRGGDVFVSIHVNAANLRWSKPAAARGYETYFLAEARTEDDRRVERMENESVRFETDATAERDDPLSFIINDMAQNEHLRESGELASLIQARLGTMHPGPSRGVKQAGFRVLVTAYMPAVLVEIGFGTNAEEAKFLTTPARQQQIAEAVATAVTEYLAHYERRVGVVGQ
ncbi:MAG: N-acetylmuramoyl-L-alanine amidase [Gemmatimonadaceae bacterium]